MGIAPPHDDIREGQRRPRPSGGARAGLHRDRRGHRCLDGRGPEEWLV